MKNSGSLQSTVSKLWSFVNQNIFCISCTASTRNVNSTIQFGFSNVSRTILTHRLDTIFSNQSLSSEKKRMFSSFIIFDIRVSICYTLIQINSIQVVQSGGLHTCSEVYNVARFDSCGELKVVGVILVLVSAM